MSETEDNGSGRRPNKRAAVFRTIGEVAENLDLPAHVLRFWESKFPQLKPLKRGGGRRYYRPEDVALLSRIRQCLYQEGYTIRGVQKLLAEGTLGTVGGAADDAPSLFPLDPVPGDGAAPTPRAARQTRRPAPEPALEPEHEPQPPPPRRLSDEERAILEAAREELLVARDMLGALLPAAAKG